MHVQKSQQLIGAHKLRILVHYLPKLHQGHVFIALPAVGDALVVLSDRSIVLVQTVLGTLQFPDIFRRKILPAVQIVADDPFHEGVNDLAGLKIAQSQQIPCIGILFVKLERPLQQGDCA